jgi:hypothetical protein
VTKRDFVKAKCERAIEAFKNHELVDTRDDRWRIAKRDKDGWFTNVYYAEIISLWGGRLYVGGDIDACVFAYYSDHSDHLSKLRWMGRCTDVSYYVRQKAQMGLTDNGKLVDEYNARVAKQDLYTYLAEWEKEADAHPDVIGIRDVFHEAAERVDDPEAMRDHLRRGLEHDIYDWEWIESIGITVSNRVIYAWAALRRLCELLDAPA